jgi:hypothetical protein
MKSRYQIRGLDLRPVPELEDSMVGDVRDFETVLKATQGMDAVIHLVNIRTNRGDWEDCLDNLTATRNVLEAAVRNGVRRVAYSSETGFWDLPGNGQRTDDDTARALLFIGKVFAEIWDSTPADTESACGRSNRRSIATAEPKHPHDLSPGDAARVFRRAVVHPGQINRVRRLRQHVESLRFGCGRR